MTSCAASLAYHGLLGQPGRFVTYSLRFEEVDLTSVPPEHWAALASWVTWYSVIIIQVSGIGLTSFLSKVKCQSLEMIPSLDREETQALVQAMESGVEELHLHSVTLDMETLVTYSGQGQCRQVEVSSFLPHGDDPEMWRVNMKEPLKGWAVSRDWAVAIDSVSYLLLKDLR